MSNDPRAIAKQTVVLELAMSNQVRVVKDTVYRQVEGTRLTYDLYLPPAIGPYPVVLIASGYPSLGLEHVFGMKPKEMGPTTSWARQLAASGLATVTYETRDPLEDVVALLAYLRAHGSQQQLDMSRIGLWAASGNVPLALGLLVREPTAFGCAAFAYGFFFDPPGSSPAATAAAQFGFANPAAQHSVADLPAIPYRVVRAGRDAFPGINGTIDHFVSQCLSRNLALTLVNLPDAVHAFDLVDRSAASLDALYGTLNFLTRNLQNRTDSDSDLE